MIWCSATGCTVRKNANVNAAPARNSAKIGVPSASKVTGRIASALLLAGDIAALARAPHPAAP